MEADGRDFKIFALTSGARHDKTHKQPVAFKGVHSTDDGV